MDARGTPDEAVTPALLAALDELVALARDEEPTIELDPGQFLRYVGERCRDIDHLVEHLQLLRAGDLWLACACAAGLNDALLRFQTRFNPDIEAAIVRSGNADVSPEDFRQHLMAKLFTAAEGEPVPRIAEYRGRGPLRGWFRITIVRQVIDFVRRTQRRDLGHQVDETELLGLRAATVDPELALVQDRFQNELRDALQEGFAALTPRERNLLRHFLIHGLSIDEVGRIYGVHRATAHRWRLRAQDALFTSTRAALRKRLGTNSTELKNAMLVMESQLHISVQRYLADESEQEA